MRVDLAILLSLCITCVAASEWKVTDVDRTIDVTSQIVKVSTLVTYENTGSSDAKDVSFALSDEESLKLAHLSATLDGNKGKLKVSDQASSAGFKAYKIDLPKPIGKGASVKLRVDYKLTEFLAPYPAKISQLDSQFVVYNGNAYFAAPYVVAKEKTTIKLASGKTVSATPVNPHKLETEKVIYGPYSSQPAFNSKPIKVHYENNSPFVVATKVERVIEISHWGGNVAVEDYIELEHKGAQLKGTFSRLDYQMDRRGRRQPALQHFTTILPASAKDIYYRDEIGNISTSAVRVRADSVDVEIKPRYPLFGGWRTSYVIGYNVPAYEYLFNKGNEYTLKMRVIDHIFDNVVVEKLTTKITLPEHVKKIKLSTPFTMERKPDELRATYLDVSGRTVVVVEKDNLIADHIQPFALSYEFEASDMLREPILAVLFFFCLFSAIIVYVHLDFTIVSDPKEEADQKLRSKISTLEDFVNKKQRLYANFSGEVAQYKSSRDDKILQDAKKDLESSRATLNEKLNTVLLKIKTDSQDSFDKAHGLMSYDKPLYDSVDHYISAITKSQQKRGSDDVVFSQKIDEARNKADSILASL